jgi:uncharacterized protein with NRDE domain
MCTLMLAYRLIQGAALLAATNRDEQLDRPASGPHTWPAGDGGAIFAPRDDLAGGSWIGLNEAGLFVAITNRFQAKLDPSRQSRGALVIGALEHATAQDAAAWVLRCGPLAHNPFHLVMIDALSAHLVWHDEQALHHQILEPGLHIITERSFSHHTNHRAQTLREQADALLQRDALTLNAMYTLLQAHHGRGLDDPLVKLPAVRYGTRSTTLVRLGDDPDDRSFDHLDHVATVA